MGYPTWVPVPLLPAVFSSSSDPIGVCAATDAAAGKLHRVRLPQGTSPPTSPPPLTTGQEFRPSESYEKGCSVTPRDDDFVRPTHWSASPAGRHFGPARVGATGEPALRAGSYTGIWPRTSRRGPGTYGTGAPWTDVLGHPTGAVG